MIYCIYLTVFLILIFNIEGTFVLKPPQDVKMVKSNLQWKPSEDDGVLYSLQYRFPSKSDEWLNVSSYIGTPLQSFPITNEYYGAVFRVRTEKGNNMSEWVNSSLVQCINVNSCVPVINLSVKPEVVFLKMEHKDKSLRKEYGDYLEFKVIQWKEDEKFEEETFPTTSENQPIYGLESGKKYCFQVGYLYYKVHYGDVSEKKCAIIPETPEEAKRRAFLYSILTTLVVSAMCGACVFVFFKKHKKVKAFLQPLPLEIPRHYEEFFYGDFPLQACPSPSNQSLRSYDMVTVIENNNLELNSHEEQYERRS